MAILTPPQLFILSSATDKATPSHTLVSGHSLANKRMRAGG